MTADTQMMAGATMQVETDALRGQAVGSLIRITGRVLGMKLTVEEVVTERVPPLRKIWETREPRLLVIGSYRMGFTIMPRGGFSRLVVFIDYQLPPRNRPWSRAGLRPRLRSMVHAAHDRRCDGGDCWRRRSMTCRPTAARPSLGAAA